MAELYLPVKKKKKVSAKGSAMTDALKDLEKEQSELSQIVSGLKNALETLELDGEEREVALRIKDKAEAAREICTEKLAPYRKEAKQKRKKEKAEKKEAQRKGQEGMRIVNKKIAQKREAVHKLSKLDQAKARFIQGGSPGLGKKS